MPLAQVIFEAAIERNRHRIANMPAAERDAYVEGIADAVGAFDWEQA